MNSQQDTFSILEGDATERVSAVMVGVEDLVRRLGQTDRAKRFATLRQFLNHPSFRVVVFGEFSRGKSTLINALLGRQVLPSKLIPTTGQVTRVLYAKSEELRVKDASGKVTRQPLDQLDQFVLLDHEGRAKEGIQVLEVAIDHPMLKSGLVLIDTPGVCEREAQTRRAKKEIAYADLILIVLDATQALTQNEQELALDFVKIQNKPVILVLNFLGRLDESAQAEVRERVEAWCRSHLNQGLAHAWLQVDALSALKQALGYTAEAPPADQTAVLRDFLRGCNGTERQHLQRRARLGQIRAETIDLIGENVDALERLRCDRSPLIQERQDRLVHFEFLGATLAINGAGHAAAVRKLAKFRLDDAERRLEQSLAYCVRSSNVEWSVQQQFQMHLDDALRDIERRAFERLSLLAGGELPASAALTLRESLDLVSSISVDQTLPQVLDTTARIGKAFAVGVVGQMLIPIPFLGGALAMTAWNLLQKSPETLADEAAGRLTPIVRSRWREVTDEIPHLAKQQFKARVREFTEIIHEQIDSLRQLALVSDSEFDTRCELALASSRLQSLLTKHFRGIGP